MNFTEISQEVLSKIEGGSIDVKNKNHMKILEEELGKYINNKELLYLVLHYFKYPEKDQN